MVNVVTEEAKQFNLDESISETNVENIKDKKNGSQANEIKRILGR